MPRRLSPRLLWAAAALIALGSSLSTAQPAPWKQGYTSSGNAQKAVDAAAIAILSGQTIRCAEYNILRDGAFQGDGCAPQWALVSA